MFCQIKVGDFKITYKCDFSIYRENSDLEPDTETIHDIKTIHLPTNQKQTSDFALIELVRSANICSAEETEDGRCWYIEPVKLPSPEIIIHENDTVRTLGIG